MAGPKNKNMAWPESFFDRFPRLQNLPFTKPTHQEVGVGSWHRRRAASFWLSLLSSREVESVRLQWRPLCRIQSVSLGKGSLFNIKTQPQLRFQVLLGTAKTVRGNGFLGGLKKKKERKIVFISVLNSLRPPHHVLDCGHWKPGDKQLNFFKFSQ